MQSRRGKARSASEAFSGDKHLQPPSPPDYHNVTREDRAAGLSSFFLYFQILKLISPGWVSLLLVEPRKS